MNRIAARALTQDTSACKIMTRKAMSISERSASLHSMETSGPDAVLRVGRRNAVASEGVRCFLTSHLRAPKYTANGKFTKGLDGISTQESGSRQRTHRTTGTRAYGHPRHPGGSDPGRDDSTSPKNVRGSTGKNF